MRVLFFSVLFFSISASAVFDGHPDFIKKMQNPANYRVNRGLLNLQSRSICGSADFQQVNDYDGSKVTIDFVNEMKTSVGALATVVEGGPSSKYCTGTLVAEDLFLTAGHCVDSKTVGDVVAFDYEYAVGTKDLIQGKEFNVIEVVESGSQFSLDYAIIRLGGTPGKEFGFKQLNLDPVFEADVITIIQHPLGEPKQVDSGTIDGFATKQLLYNDVDTRPGSSGSGVIDQDGYVIGVHTNGGCGFSGGSNKGTRVEVMAQESALVTSLARPPVVPVPSEPVPEEPIPGV